MSARLLGEMHVEAERSAERAAGYKMAGERDLAGLASAAAVALSNAVEALVLYQRAEGEAQERGREA